MRLSSKVKKRDKCQISDDIIQDIIKAVTDLEYGSVLIKVHDSRVVQIEVTERKRFDQIWKLEKGGGI